MYNTLNSFLFLVTHSTSFYMFPFSKASAPWQGGFPHNPISPWAVAACPAFLQGSAPLPDQRWQLALIHIWMLLCLEEIPAALPYVLPLLSPDFCQLRTLSAFQQIKRNYTSTGLSQCIQEVRRTVFRDISDRISHNGFSLGHHEGNRSSLKFLSHSGFSPQYRFKCVYIYLEQTPQTSSELSYTSEARASKSPYIHKLLSLWLPA